jgi:hypothetical protein
MGRFDRPDVTPEADSPKAKIGQLQLPLWLDESSGYKAFVCKLDKSSDYEPVYW